MTLDPAVSLILFIVILSALLLCRVSVAVALLTVSTLGAILIFGFQGGIDMTITSMVSSIASFVLVTVPLFIFMGELLFRSGLAFSAIAAVDRMLGRLPGRLAYLTIITGSLLGVLSGSAMASTAILAGSLIPEMMKKGYSKSLGMGTILGSGGLAMILPPSTITVIWGATAGVPIGPLLIACIVPGLLMAAGYSGVILIRTHLFGDAELPARIGAKARLRQRELAVVGVNGSSPTSTTTAVRERGDEQASTSLLGGGSGVDLVLLVGMIVAVLGLMLFGVVTPSESAAVGVIAALLIALIRRKLTLSVVVNALKGTVLACGMVFFIVAAAAAYGRVMAASGIVNFFGDAMLSITTNPMVLVILMLVIVVILGLALESIATCLLTIPIFMPIVTSAGIDPIWFGVLMIIAIQIGELSPPFGMALFIMRQFAPRGTTMNEIYSSAVPFVLSDFIVVSVLMIFPVLATFLPSLM